MTDLSHVQALFVVLALASSACANSSATEHLLAENARLQAENARLKISNARIGQLETEIARLLPLKVELARLQAEQNIAASKLDTTDFDLEESAHGSDIRADVQTTNVGGTASLGFMDEDIQWKTCGPIDNTCPNNCQGKCWMKQKAWHKNCTMVEWQYKAQISPPLFKYVGSHDHPQWSLFTGRANLLGTISCPCKRRGVAISAELALRTILGQVAAMGMPRNLEGQLCDCRKQGKKSVMASFWNAKVALATVRLLHCWKARCSLSGGNIDDFLDTADSFGGGSFC